MSETKLKEHKPNDIFNIAGFQLPFIKITIQMAVEEQLFMYGMVFLQKEQRF